MKDENIKISKNFKSAPPGKCKRKGKSKGKGKIKKKLARNIIMIRTNKSGRRKNPRTGNQTLRRSTAILIISTLLTMIIRSIIQTIASSNMSKTNTIISPRMNVPTPNL